MIRMIIINNMSNVVTPNLSKLGVLFADKQILLKASITLLNMNIWINREMQLMSRIADCNHQTQKISDADFLQRPTQ